MQAIQEGQVPPEAPRLRRRAGSALRPYQPGPHHSRPDAYPGLHQRPHRLALWPHLSGRTRLELRVTAARASLMKFADINSFLDGQNAVGVMSLGADMASRWSLSRDRWPSRCWPRRLAIASQVRARQCAAELTHVEKVVLRNVLSMLSEAMATSWEGVLSFKPQVLRFESDPRMAAIATPSDRGHPMCLRDHWPADGR